MKRKPYCFVAVLTIIIVLINNSTFVYAKNSTLEDALGERIEQYIEERREGTASVSTAVFNGSETVYSTQYGYSNVENQIEVDEDTVYEWGSVTKLLVWVSVMQLHEQGKIDIDANINEYLPENFLTKLNYDAPITMIHLMSHTAGFQETLYSVETDDSEEIVSLEQALRQSEPTQIYVPGEVCSYSNWGVSLAAYIVECISGQTIDAYVKTNIFEPLGMEHTSLLPDCSDNSWVKQQREELYCYSIYEDSFESLGQCISYILLYPSGAATGTINDLLTFAKEFVPNEGETSRLFENKDTLDLLLSPTSYYADTQLVRNCHGLWTLPYGEGVVGHSGNTSGCTTSLYFDPDSKMGIVVMTNEVGETAYSYGLLSAVFGDYEMSTSITSSDRDISGIYTSSRATFKNGIGKAFRYIGSLLPLGGTEDPQVYKVVLGQGKVTRIADNVYLMDNENGLATMVVRTTDDEGVTKLENFVQDMFLENSVTFFVKIFVLLLFVITILCAFVMLIVNLINLLWRKWKKKERINMEDIFRTCIYIMIVASGWLVYSILLSDYITYPATVAICVFLCIFSIIAFIYGIITAKKSNKAILIMGTIMLSNVIYWQWFNFMSF
ncbi:MAG: serine hydrolase domain-containing protein [Suipraeoptans sp.]